MSAESERTEPNDPMQEKIAEALKRGCRVVREDGGFLGKSWFQFEGEGEGVDTIRDLIEEYGDVASSQFAKQFSPIFREQLEVGATDFWPIKAEVRDNRIRHYDKGGRFDVIIATGPAYIFNDFGYDGRFQPKGFNIPLQKPQQQETVE